ncbi:MAG: PaaI family thioesterase [Oscillospiraceae bacterium]|jgi:acyl-CoA thioesterase|nr:PaaI family thioesterase [Oscillospiraceae bacterium]
MTRTLEQLREYFLNDRFVMDNGIGIDSIGEDSAIVSARLEPRHTNALGMAQGGFLFTLADFAMGVAANLRSGVAVTLSSSINYLKSPKGAIVYAEATPLKVGRSTRVYTVRVYDDRGTECCNSTFTAFVTNPDSPPATGN